MSYCRQLPTRWLERSIHCEDRIQHCYSSLAEMSTSLIDGLKGQYFLILGDLVPLIILIIPVHILGSIQASRGSRSLRSPRVLGLLPGTQQCDHIMTG